MKGRSIHTAALFLIAVKRSKFSMRDFYSALSAQTGSHFHHQMAYSDTMRSLLL